MYPVAVRVHRPEPPRTGDLVFDAKAGEFRCDGYDIVDAESELHLRDWSVARRKELKNGTCITDLTVDQVWSARVVVVEQCDADSAVERCGLVHVGYKQREFQQRVCSHGASVAALSDNSWPRDEL